MQEVKGNASHKILIVSIIVVAVLIVATIAYLFYSAKKVVSTNELQSENSPEDQLLASCLNSCNLCEQNCHDNFFLESAQKNEDESICDKIENEFVKSECKDSFALAKALAELDSTLCGSLSEDKQASCIYSVTLSKAISTDDVSVCETSEDSNSCKDNFYFQKKLCENIVDEELKQTCIDLLNSENEGM